MIGMEMGVDDGGHRFLRYRAKDRQDVFRRLGAQHAVDDDDAVLSYDHRGIGGAVAHGGVDGFRDLYHLPLEFAGQDIVTDFQRSVRCRQ